MYNFFKSSTFHNVRNQKETVMEMWISEHPWWTAFIVYSLIAIGAMFAVWCDSDIDEYGQPETTITGYIMTYLLWWLPLVMAILCWMIPGRDTAKRSKNRPPAG